MFGSACNQSGHAPLACEAIGSPTETDAGASPLPAEMVTCATLDLAALEDEAKRCAST